jgi:acetyl-CoA acetyltransferase
MDTNDQLDLIRCLGIEELRYTPRSRGGGGVSGSTIQQAAAAAAVATGMADNVLVYRAFNERSGRRFGQPQRQTPDPSWNLYAPFGLDTPMKVYSLWFQRYMFRYGVTNADVGLYSVAARRYASTNPAAWYFGNPLTIEEHQSSRWIVEPVLRRYDCCQESDGGVAIILSRADQSSRFVAPVRVLGALQAHSLEGNELFSYYHSDLTTFPRQRRSLGSFAPKPGSQWMMSTLPSSTIT